MNAPRQCTERDVAHETARQRRKSFALSDARRGVDWSSCSLRWTTQLQALEDDVSRWPNSDASVVGGAGDVMKGPIGSQSCLVMAGGSPGALAEYQGQRMRDVVVLRRDFAHGDTSRSS